MFLLQFNFQKCGLIDISLGHLLNSLFNLERTLLASFLMSAIRSSSSTFVPEENGQT